MNKLGGRKFLLTVLGSVFLLLIILTKSELAEKALTALIALIGVYSGSNMISKFSKK